MNFKIAHWSDLHTRLATRHEEYKTVVDRFVEQVKKEKPDLIVFTGDLFHNKVNMSPESFEFATYLFNKLHKIAPNVIIRGNHDENQGNRNRLDAITPFVELFNEGKKAKDKLFYLKESGVHEFNAVRFFVYPMREGELPDVTKTSDDKIDVALFHGIMKGAVNDFGYEFGDSKYNIPHEEFDAVMLGDIHKHQFLKENMAYAGSLIQQNWGEEPIKHGYILWEFEDNKLKGSTFKRIENDWGYYKIYVEDGDYAPKYDNIPDKATVKIIHPISAVKDDMAEDLEEEYGVTRSQIQFEEEGIDLKGKVINVQDDIVNLHNFENQVEIVKEYFEDDEDIEEILELNEKLFGEIKLELNSDTRRTIWGVTKLEFDNLFCYGENNYFNFENNRGCMGFFSPNRSGKSSLLDSLSFAIFGESPHTSTYSDIINHEKDSYRSYVKLYNNENRLFSIERTGRKSPSSVTNSITFTEYDQNGEVLNEESDMRTAKELIENTFGDAKTYEKTAYIYQDNQEKFLNLTPAKRKEWLYNNIGLEVFKLLHERAKEESKDLKNHIDYLEGKNLGDVRTRYRNMISEKAKERDEIQQEYDEVEEKIEGLRGKIEDLQSQKNSIDKNLEDQTENIENYKDKISQKEDKIKKYENTEPEKDQDLVDKKSEKEEELKDLKEKGYDTKLPEEEDKEDQLEELKKQGNSLNEEIEKFKEDINFWKEKHEDFVHDWGTKEKIEKEIENVKEIEKKSDELLTEISIMEKRESRLQGEVDLLDTDERFENEELCQTCPLLEDVFGKKKELEDLQFELKSKKKKYEDLIAGDEDLEQLESVLRNIEQCEREIDEYKKDLKHAKQRRDDLRNNFKSINKDLESLKKRRKEIIDQKIENVEGSIENLNQKIESDLKQKKQDIVDTISKLKAEKKEYENSLEKSKKLQDEWEKQQKLIKENEEIECKISDKKETLQTHKDSLNDINEKLVDIKSDIKNYVSMVGQIKKEQQDLKESLEKYSVYDKYIKATHKNEIPLKVVESMLQVIQHEVNKIVSQITDFRLRLFVEGSDIVCNIIDDRGEREANRLSGMERFTSNLAFRFAIAQIGNMPIPDFIIVDEGFSSIDSTTSQDMPTLINFLKDKFEFIMVVSHYENMRDFVDFNIDIDNTGTFSQIQVD